MNRTAPNSPYTALDNPVPTVAATDLVTSGNRQIVIQCPCCGEHHRHLGLGLRRSPCGAWYVVAAPGRPAPTLTAA